MCVCVCVWKALLSKCSSQLPDFITFYSSSLSCSNSNSKYELNGLKMIICFWEHRCMLINLFYCYLFIVILLLLCLFIVAETKLPLWGWWFFWLHLLTLTQRGIFILRLCLCEGILGQTAAQSQQHRRNTQQLIIFCYQQISSEYTVNFNIWSF